MAGAAATGVHDSISGTYGHRQRQWQRQSYWHWRWQPQKCPGKLRAATRFVGCDCNWFLHLTFVYICVCVCVVCAVICLAFGLWPHLKLRSKVGNTFVHTDLCMALRCRQQFFLCDKSLLYFTLLSELFMRDASVRVCVFNKQFTIHMFCRFIGAINLNFCKTPWNDMKTFDSDICAALERLRLPSGSSLRTVALRPEVSHNERGVRWAKREREEHVSRTNVNMLITKYKRTLCTKCFVWHTQCCCSNEKLLFEYPSGGYMGSGKQFVRRKIKLIF